MDELAWLVILAAFLAPECQPDGGPAVCYCRRAVLCVSVSADAGVFAGDDGVWLGWI